MPSGFPFMQLWIADYLAKSSSLAMTGHGALILLLIELWQRDGRLPFDKDKIRIICRGYKKTDWTIIQGVVDEFFFIDEEGFFAQRKALRRTPKGPRESRDQR